MHYAKLFYIYAKFEKYLRVTYKALYAPLLTKHIFQNALRWKYVINIPDFPDYNNIIFVPVSFAQRQKIPMADLPAKYYLLLPKNFH